MRVNPSDLANYIRGLMLSFDLMPCFDAETLSIGLNLILMEEVPDHLFLNLRFEMLVPIRNLEDVKDLNKRLELIRTDRQYSKITFSVDDVLAEPGSKPSYVLRLVPTERLPGEKVTASNNQDNRSTFESLIHQMSLTGHPHKKDVTLEWRNGFNLLRFYHLKHQEKKDRAHVPNSQYVPVFATRLSDLISRLPVDENGSDPRSDDEAIRALLLSADDAFNDPTDEFIVSEPRAEAVVSEPRAEAAVSEPRAEAVVSEPSEVAVSVHFADAAFFENPRQRRESLGYEAYYIDVDNLNFLDLEDFDLDAVLRQSA